MSALQDLLQKADSYKQKISSTQPLAKEELKSLADYFRVGFTYSSNALKGNTHTISETKIILEDGLTVGGRPLKDCYDAADHGATFDFLLELERQQDMNITEDTIKRLLPLIFYMLPLYTFKVIFYSLALKRTEYRQTANHSITKKGSVIMPLPQERIYTIDDIYALPDGTRAELINGQIYYMAPPNRVHQKVSGFLFQKIANHISSNNGECEVYSAPFAVFLHKDDTTYIEPDISVICNPNKLDNKGCIGAPDWVIEITSPSNSGYDYVDKLSLYRSAGVREYWIVNPIKKNIFVYFFEEIRFNATMCTFQDKVKVSIYDDLYIDFQEISL